MDTSSEKLRAYIQGGERLPDHQWLWPLYGQGMENLGRNGHPIQVEMPAPGPDELLVRHDAIGLCFSDTKVINVGEEHPRLHGRNMQTDPVVLGHEVALTIVDVGENLTDQYQQGDRFIVQADIYYQGVGLAYGYALQGGLSQYNIVGKEILHGDEGCYLLPLADHMGYAQGALTEPWACVVASYDIAYRTAWQPGGRVLMAGGPAAGSDVTLGDPYDAKAPPESVYVLDVPADLLAQLDKAANDRGFKLVPVTAIQEIADQTFDDIVLLGADNALYEQIEPLAANGALINLVCAGGFQDKAKVDVGRLHYDHLGLVGTDEPVISNGYTPIRTEFRPGGYMALMGAAGPMGQMHFQRALQATANPEMIVATSRVMDRLALLPSKFQELIAAQSGTTQVLVMASSECSPETFNANLMNATGGKGYDDIIVLAPSAQVAEDAVDMLAPGGVANVFAGLPRGTKMTVDLDKVVTQGIRLVGSSGSAIADLQRMLDEAESGRLDPNMSVVAVSGLNDAKAGIEGVIALQFPGKVVVYPQILDFPLTYLSDLEEKLPQVYAALGPSETWTVEAEMAFLEALLP